MLEPFFLLAEVAELEVKNHTIDGVSAIAALVIASFAVDRFANLGLFCISFIPSFEDADRPDDRAHSDLPPRRKIIRFIYFLFALVAAITIAVFGDMGILESLGFKRANRTTAHHCFDLTLTVLILTAGAERISKLVQATSGGSIDEGDQQRPVEIAGTLTLDPEVKEQLAQNESIKRD